MIEEIRRALWKGKEGQSKVSWDERVKSYELKGENWIDFLILFIILKTPLCHRRVNMKIKWYGHAAFLITSDQGTKIIIDPYEPGAFGGQLSYGKINDQADIVLASHDHADHNYTKDLPGKPQIVKGSGSKTIGEFQRRESLLFTTLLRGVNEVPTPSSRSRSIIFNSVISGTWPSPER